MHILLFDLFVGCWNSLWTVSVPLSSQVGLFGSRHAGTRHGRWLPDGCCTDRSGWRVRWAVVASQWSRRVLVLDLRGGGRITAHCVQGEALASSQILRVRSLHSCRVEVRVVSGAYLCLVGVGIFGSIGFHHYSRRTMGQTTYWRRDMQITADGNAAIFGSCSRPSSHKQMVGLGGQESAVLAERGGGGTQRILDDIYVVVSNLKRE
ncbi:hypothetical protein B0H14DRAFT_2641020 [Mycena olivaceomarginata]|nr:hypothetical protein B0H14DRAFT_2641020 [Mycena olivaceomarginata]